MSNTKLIFATSNLYKAKEVASILGIEELLTLKDFGIDDIVEDGSTLQENACIKSNFVWTQTGHACFSDDTGLFVDAIGGLPGIHSARFAGEAKKNEDNIELLLHKLIGKQNRKAFFKTVICYTSQRGNQLFEGELHGSISLKPIGNKGFGYDSIFIPKGYTITLAEMTQEEKNCISHRMQALKGLSSFLRHL
jgi:XTP/dITP diphosphohydrolase